MNWNGINDNYRYCTFDSIKRYWPIKWYRYRLFSKVLIYVAEIGNSNASYKLSLYFIPLVNSMQFYRALTTVHESYVYWTVHHCDSTASACKTDTTPTQPHRISNTHRTTNNTTNVVIQQNSRKILMMDILMSETWWADKKWNKIASDIKLVFYFQLYTTSWLNDKNPAFWVYSPYFC